METLSAYTGLLIRLASVGSTVAIVMAGAVVAIPIGYALYHWQPQNYLRVLKWAASVVSTVVFLLGTALVLFLRSASTPALDSATFDQRDTTEVVFTLKDGKTATVLLDAPRSVPIDEDAVVELRLMSIGLPAKAASAPATAASPAAGQLQRVASDSVPAFVRFGSAVRVRAKTATTACLPELAASAAKPDKSSDDPVAACGTVTAATSMRFQWVVRADKPGSSIGVVTLPEQASKLVRDGGWSATVKSNGRTWTRFVTGPDDRPWTPGGNRGMGVREKVVQMTAATPFHRRGAVEVDLSAGEIQIPLTFETTLGMTAATYQILAAIGTFLAGAVGGGWLWQVQLWWRKRNEKPQHLPVRRRDERDGR